MSLYQLKSCMKFNYFTAFAKKKGQPDWAEDAAMVVAVGVVMGMMVVVVVASGGNGGGAAGRRTRGQQR